jgi:hypothetical protein
MYADCEMAFALLRLFQPENGNWRLQDTLPKPR